MFATDRDLLMFEPRLFFDVSWASQKLVDSASGGSINSAGDTLTLSGGTFDSLGIGEGFVVIAGATPLEVVERLSATQVRISRLRASAGDALIPAASGSGLKVVIHTFRPQIAIVHRQVMRMLGIEPGGGSSPRESDITNPSSLVPAEALGALHLIFSSAAALVGGDSTLWVKARMYEERFRRERRRVVAEIDLDGDGRADTIRRASAAQFMRA